jgi:hypothetical protein
MKKTLTILLLLACVSIQAQWNYPTNRPMTFWEKNGRAIGVTAWHVGTVAAGAIGDGLNDRGDKEWGHALKALEVGLLLSGPFVWKIERGEWCAYVAPYILHRYALYDMWWNIMMDQHLLYNGESSLYDNTMNKMPPDGKIWTKSISFGLSIAIPFNNL